MKLLKESALSSRNLTISSLVKGLSLGSTSRKSTKAANTLSVLMGNDAYRHSIDHRDIVLIFGFQHKHQDRVFNDHRGREPSILSIRIEEVQRADPTPATTQTLCQLSDERPTVTQETEGLRLCRPPRSCSPGLFRTRADEWT